MVHAAAGVTAAGCWCSGCDAGRSCHVCASAKRCCSAAQLHWPEPGFVSCFCAPAPHCHGLLGTEPAGAAQLGRGQQGLQHPRWAQHTSEQMRVLRGPHPLSFPATSGTHPPGFDAEHSCLAQLGRGQQGLQHPRGAQCAGEQVRVLRGPQALLQPGPLRRVSPDRADGPHRRVALPATRAAACPGVVLQPCCLPCAAWCTPCISGCLFLHTGLCSWDAGALLPQVHTPHTLAACTIMRCCER